MTVQNNRLRNSKILTMSLAFTAIFSAATSCTDDDTVSFIPELPAEGGNNIKGIERTGGIPNTTYDWNFNYRGPRLTDASGVIRDPDNKIDGSFKYSCSIRYGNRAIDLSNSSGENIRAVLNGSNYIESMTIGKDIYEFEYKDKHLSRWEKIVFEGSLGQASQYKSSATLTYENDDLKSIDFVGPDNVKVTTTFTPHVYNNMNGLLPEAVAKEMGCLGFEYLYYAGLLGRPTAHLVKSLSVNHPTDQESCYTLDFDYSLKGNNTTLCNYKNPKGEPVAVIYKY